MKIKNTKKYTDTNADAKNKIPPKCANQNTNSTMKDEHQYPQRTRKDRSIGLTG